MSFYTIRQWIYLGWVDIKGRYRRTALGPFWLVITTFISIAMMGVVYGTIFKVSLSDYIPYIAAGIIVWFFINGFIIESCNGLISYKFLLLTKPIPVSLIIVRIASRNLIIFFHNLIVLILCLIFFNRLFSVLYIHFFIGVIINSLIGISLGISLSLICVRFRDIVQLITSLMSIMFLVTPIVWNKELLEHRDYLASWNIFTHLIDLIREPLLGKVPTLNTYITTLLVLLIFTLIARYLTSKFRNFTYWL